MNMDDPKLTAFALGELDGAEQAEIERLILQSPAAKRFVDETRALAAQLQVEYAQDLEAPGVLASRRHRTSLIDIHDDPWFWVKARPLALAATIAFCAIVGAVTFAKYRTKHTGAPSDIWPLEVESDLPLPNTAPNPLSAESARKIEHIVVGEVIDTQPGGEVRQIERISDSYRVAKMRAQIATPTLSRNRDGVASRTYQLLFLDRDGGKIAAAYFYRTNAGQFVLQLLPLPQSHADPYLSGSKYVMPFNEWMQAIGYAPG